METAIIAGVGPGLGTSLAHAFAGQGYAVALLSRSSETSTRVAEEIVRANGKALVVQTDVTRLESVKTLWRKSDQSWDRSPLWHTTPVVMVVAVS